LAIVPLITVKFRSVFLAGWLFMAGLHNCLLIWLDFNWEIALTDSIISNILLAAACYLISNNLQYYRPQHGTYAFISIWCFVLTTIWILALRWFLPIFYTNEAEYLDFFFKSLPVRYFIGFLMLGWMALISLIWYNELEQKENDNRKADIEKLAREAELFKLRQQLQPHFLFNSLNSINALIGSQPKDARKMIQQLSDFLRSTLKKDDNEWVTLEEEMEHLALYLEIEKMRFGHRLATVIHFENESGCHKLPPMLLQPIVENAIKFGLYDTTDTVTITINATCQDNLLVIKVQNPFDSQTTPPQKGTGFGLSGLHRRLYLLFGRHDLLQTKTDENNIFTTILKIPQV
jgi:two-component system LytT family sensor kinase